MARSRRVFRVSFSSKTASISKKPSRPGPWVSRYFSCGVGFSSKVVSVKPTKRAILKSDFKAAWRRFCVAGESFFCCKKCRYESETALASAWLFCSKKAQASCGVLRPRNC